MDDQWGTHCRDNKSPIPTQDPYSVKVPCKKWIQSTSFQCIRFQTTLHIFCSIFSTTTTFTSSPFIHWDATVCINLTRLLSSGFSLFHVPNTTVECSKNTVGHRQLFSEKLPTFIQNRRMQLVIIQLWIASADDNFIQKLIRLTPLSVSEVWSEIHGHLYAWRIFYDLICMMRM